MRTALQWLYGILAVLGVVLPWRFNFEWMQTSEATGAFDFVRASMANAASTSISLDIAIVFVCFSVWVLVEGRRLGMRYAWLFIPYAALVALASAFPLFLLLRSRRMQD
jgi:hypothetical protein